MPVIGLILLAILTGFTQNVQTKEVAYRCDEGWWKFGDRCYGILGNKFMAKTNAINVCTAAKAQLFVPSSIEEYKAVSAYIDTLGPVTTPDNPTAISITDVWVGCDDVDEEGTFSCIDGTTFKGTSGWWEGEFENFPDEDCLLYEKPNAIRIQSCETKSWVLCEAPAAVTRSSTYTASSLSNRCLRGYKTVHRKSRTRCAAECLKEDYCVSFNFKDGVCDLNYSTRNQGDFSVFEEEEEGCSYYEP